MTDTDSIIDAALENVSIDTNEVAEEQQDESNDVVDAEAEQDNEEQDEEQLDDTTDDVFPKKAVNAIDRRNKKIVKLKGQNQEIRNQMRQMEQSYQNLMEAKAAPQEDDFDNYGDLLDARAKHNIEEQFTSRERAQLEAAYNDKQSQLQQIKAQNLTEQVNEVSSAIPDFMEVKTQYDAVLDSFPQEIAEVFLDADNAPLAFYTLAKEGRLEDLAYMQPAHAAIVLAHAQERGRSFLNEPKKPIPTTKAPKPMTSVKGTGSQSKNLAQMSGDELMSWMKS